MSSRAFRACTEGWATSTKGVAPITVMGVMSSMASNGADGYTCGFTTWLLDTTPITEPSLGARTSCVVPVMPPAPGRFSITTGWPSALDRLA